MKYKFKVGNLGITWVGSNFKEWFGEMYAKPKKWQPHTIILPKNMNDKEIEEVYHPSEVSLDEVAHLLKTKEHLLDNGYANIFYMKDTSGVLRVVSVHWNDDGWNVYAYTVPYSDRWDGGYQVFSRNPLESQKTLSTLDTLFLTRRVEELEEWKEKMIEGMNEMVTKINTI